MKLKPYYLGLVIILLLGLTASSAFGVGSAGSVTGGTFPVCVDPANTSTAKVNIAGKQVAPGGLVRVPEGTTTCTASETTLNLNSYVKTILVSPGATNVASGTNLQNALNVATAGMLVKVEPGTYDLVTTALTIKQGVDLEGSGEGLTKITSQIGSVVFPPVSGTVVITSSSEIRFLSIANTANSDYTLAVYASGVDKTARLTNVTLSATGTTGLNYGSYNDNASSTSIQNSTITTSGGASNRSIFNDNGSSPTILNSTITATGSNSNLGIYNNTTSFPIIQNSTITASGGSSNNYGLFNFFSSPTVQNSIITTSGSGLNFSIFNNGGITRVGVSQLGGAVSGTVLCVLSYSATYVALNPSCA